MRAVQVTKWFGIIFKCSASVEPKQIEELLAANYTVSE